jgi:hypothetical protein
MDRSKGRAFMSDASSNGQYQSPPFGVGGDYASTGLGGTQGDTASQTEGPVVASPVVSTPFGSSQVAANMPRQAVTTGDTSGMSSDQAVGDNFSKLAGVAQDAMTATGMGTGHAVSPPHPNAGRGA